MCEGHFAVAVADSLDLDRHDCGERAVAGTRRGELSLVPQAGTVLALQLREVVQEERQKDAAAAVACTEDMGGQEMSCSYLTPLATHRISPPRVLPRACQWVLPELTCFSLKQELYRSPDMCSSCCASSSGRMTTGTLCVSPFVASGVR